MLHAGHALARRLEGLICAEFRRLAEAGRTAFPDAGVERMDVADGVALWLGQGSPVNTAVGLGMHGQVAGEELGRLEAFYHDRGADAVTSVCPLADPSLLYGLRDRGWGVSEFEHVLVLELDDRMPSSQGASRAGGQSVHEGGVMLETRVCVGGERQIWAEIATRGFSDGAAPGRGQEEFGQIMVARNDAVLVLALLDGRPVGTGALVVDGGVGWLLGDSTLAEFRRQGVQQAIQRHRLRLAHEVGCDLAVTEAAPGSVSQRNMERSGFRIAYTHVEFAKPRG